MSNTLPKNEAQILPSKADRNVRAPMPEPWRWDRTQKQPQRRRVYEMVAGKCQWDGPLSEAEAVAASRIGSKGWNTRGYLPHYDQPGALQLITFRLGDAMPATRRHEWESLFKLSSEREKRIKLEHYLDLGCGECHLGRRACAQAVEDTLLEFDGVRYRLAAWVVMPNHVHVLVALWTMPLGRLCKAWKGASARKLNIILRREGKLWQEDYWDRWIRDEEHFRKAVKYIEGNPVKAGLVSTAVEWPFSSANSKWEWTEGSRYASGHLQGRGWVNQGPVPHRSTQPANSK